jgi:hypothetical protein
MPPPGGRSVRCLRQGRSPQCAAGPDGDARAQRRQPIAPYFDARPDGSPAVELRLWHALDLQLLAPFEYYACDDATDFSAVPWDRPGEREAVDNLVTGNDVRAKLVVNEWRRLASDARQSRPSCSACRWRTPSS